MKRSRAGILLVITVGAASLAGSVAALPPLAHDAAHHARPKAVRYRGHTSGGRSIFIDVAGGGRSLTLVAFHFRCGKRIAATSLQDIPIKHTKSGYGFRIRIYGSFGFKDDRLDQNGVVRISGHFSRSAKRVAGHVLARSSRCRHTRTASWAAVRR